MNYCVTQKELLSIVYSLKYFKQYLMGRQFRIRTDHAPLTWLRGTPEPVGQQAHWLEILEEYNFSVEHRPGVRHANVDALSRHPCTAKSCTCKGHQLESCHVVKTVSEAREFTMETDDAAPSVEADTEFWSLEGLYNAQGSDPDISYILKLMENSEKSQHATWWHASLKTYESYGACGRDFEFGMVCLRGFVSMDGSYVTWQVILLKQVRREFLTVIHGRMTGGHRGRKWTAALIQARTYWPTWSSDLDAFLRECRPFAQYHHGSALKKAHLRTPMVGQPWFCVSIDITGPHLRSPKSNQYILTLVDHFSKWAEAILLRNHTALTVAPALMVNVFVKFSAPLQIFLDCGSEFESELFSELMKWMEIDELRTTAYQPSCNGMVERFHRTLATPTVQKICQGSCGDFSWEHACHIRSSNL